MEYFQARSLDVRSADCFLSWFSKKLLAKLSKNIFIFLPPPPPQATSPHRMKAQVSTLSYRHYPPFNKKFFHLPLGNAHATVLKPAPSYLCNYWPASYEQKSLGYTIIVKTVMLLGIFITKDFIILSNSTKKCAARSRFIRGHRVCYEEDEVNKKRNVFVMPWNPMVIRISCCKDWKTRSDG